MTTGRASTVVFVCEHGSAKSVIAAAHFQRLAAGAGLDVRAVSRGTDPDPAFPPNALDGLERDGLHPLDDAPKFLDAGELANARRVVAFCAVPDSYSYNGPIKQWDVPAVSDDYDTARRAIVSRVEHLVRELGSQV
jgi:protein-tyrosine-phosphatase